MTNISTAEKIIEWSVLGNISSLNLNCSDLYTLPPSLFQPYFQFKLKELYAKGNKLEELPDQLSFLMNLSVLHVPNNRIQFISDKLSLPKSLSKLCISQNNLKSIPDSFESLTNLEVFEADRNCIKIIPKSLSTLPKLHTLNLSQNLIRNIPTSISSANSLEVLILDSNRIIMLPPQICLLPRLSILSLCSNSIQALPHNIHAATQLSQLLVDNNPTLSSLPGSILMLELDIIGLNGCGGVIFDPLRDHTHIEQYNLSLKALCLNRLCQWLDDPKLTDNSPFSELFGIPKWIASKLSIQGYCYSCRKPFYLPRVLLVTHHFKYHLFPQFTFPGHRKPIKLTFTFCSIQCVNNYGQLF
ncbi:Leucine-rich repeat-containing protein 28-like [Oopsacas minuta]|uniref:Leucine-rich repeat-containing protein 28-like n=1 Tax=Oopsacas minuta TaxID=111878 RepID=A0AAV7K1H0_9METZ|nr:Leucine-rich repeat-containing protein 28-like [Oopsacas minuta]